MSTNVSTAVLRNGGRMNLIQSVWTMELSRVFCHRKLQAVLSTHVGHGRCIEDDREWSREGGAFVAPARRRRK